MPKDGRAEYEGVSSLLSWLGAVSASLGKMVWKQHLKHEVHLMGYKDRVEPRGSGRNSESE